MDRLIMQDVRKWYESDDGRILFLCGAPKVGKTWVIEELCRQTGCEYMRISVGTSWKEVSELKGLKVLIIHDIYNDKTMTMAKKIIMSLRADESVCESKIIMEANVMDKSWFRQHFIDEDYVKRIQVFPLNFMEYKNVMTKRYNYDDAELVKMYLLTGGLPKCVKYFYKYGDFTGVRDIQRMLLLEICKREDTKCREILKSVPLQLMSSHTGFKYRQINPNARKRQHGVALNRLEKNGIIYRIRRLREGDYTKEEDFKVYIYDVGLLTSLMETDVRNVMDMEALKEMHNRCLIKSFIVQEIISLELQDICDICYWIKRRAKARIPLVMYIKKLNVTIPILISDGKRYEKSLDSFEKFHEICRIYRMNVARTHIDDRDSTMIQAKNIDVPLWNIYKIKEHIKGIIKYYHAE